MRILIRLHVWSNANNRDYFYGEKTVEIPVFPAMITICGHEWKLEDTDGFVLCYDVKSDAYTVDLEKKFRLCDFHDYVQEVGSIGFVNPFQADKQ